KAEQSRPVLEVPPQTYRTLSSFSAEARISEREMGGGPPGIIGAENVAAGFATRGRVAGFNEFLAAAVFSTFANTGLFCANGVEATRRVGNEDRAKASAAGVGRVTAVRQQYVEAIGVPIGRMVPAGAIERPYELRHSTWFPR